MQYNTIQYNTIRYRALLTGDNREPRHRAQAGRRPSLRTARARPRRRSDGHRRLGGLLRHAHAPPFAPAARSNASSGVPGEKMLRMLAFGLFYVVNFLPGIIGVLM